jgi:hypothetical protein
LDVIEIGIKAHVLDIQETLKSVPEIVSPHGENTVTVYNGGLVAEERPGGDPPAPGQPACAHICQSNFPLVTSQKVLVTNLRMARWRNGVSGADYKLSLLMKYFSYFQTVSGSLILDAIRKRQSVVDPGSRPARFDLDHNMSFDDTCNR